MIKSKAKDKRHPKIINQWMVYEGINEINSVFGVLIAFKSYMRSEDFNKYHGEVIIESLQTYSSNFSDFKNKLTIALCVPSIVVSLIPDASALKFTSDKIFLRDSNKILIALV